MNNFYTHIKSINFQKTGRKFQITDLDGHFNAAVQDGKIPERYLAGDTRILRSDTREIATIQEET